jgi:hypothetical protein
MIMVVQRQLIILLSSLFLLLSAGPVSAEPILIDDFRQGINPGWSIKEFQGKNNYRPAIEDNIPCLRSESNNTASGLIYDIKYDPGQYPILTWKWKVDDIIENGDATSKAGDDYAARIYVVFPSFFFWNTRSLNYIWANKLPKGEAIPSSFTSNSMMVAVESGRDNIGKWLEIRRNIDEDFERYFGLPVPDVGAIAIMTDTDNTGGRASACYGTIQIDSAEKQVAEER